MPAVLPLPVHQKSSSSAMSQLFFNSPSNRLVAKIADTPFSRGVLCCMIGFIAYPIGPLLVIGPENLVLFSSVLFTQFVLVGIFFISTLEINRPVD